MSSTSMAAAMAAASPFTVAQWHELEHQALILKYLLAGMTVPPDLLFPIQKSFESLSSRFFPNTALGYCSFYGKKVDPEPGRCRRTDGKKWRCSKDAYGDSKYCERHMHRGRNRSRKPVEPSQTTTNTTTTTTSSSSQSPLLSATAAVSSVTASGDNSYNSGGIGGGGSGGGGGRYQNIQMNAFGSDQSQLHLENIPYGIPHKDYRYLYGLKADVGEHSFFSEASGKSLQVDSSLDGSWPLTSSEVSLFPPSKHNDYSMLQNDYSQNSFIGNDYGTGSDSAKQGGNLIRPFFEEFSKTKNAWPSDLENEISKRSSFSSTQLSISIPMGSSDLSGTNSRSPP